jgi:hypothetical protein
LHRFYILAIGLLHIQAFARMDSARISRSALYLEIAGHGGYGSINYEHAIFQKKRQQLFFRMGLSTYRITDYTRNFNPDIILPALLHYCIGKKNKLDLGIGQTFASVVQKNKADSRPDRRYNTHSILCIGYRFQKAPQGILFRIAYTPVLAFNKYYRHWGGLSLGYSF